MSLILITPPAAEPITLAEMKLHLRVDHAVEDDLIASLITAAREYAETATGRALVTQVWEVRLDGFPRGPIILRRPPIANVVSITYLDPSRVSTVLNPSRYLLNEIDAEVAPNGEPWPATADRFDAVKVRYTAGYGTAADVPDILKAAIRLLVSHWYEERAPVGAAALREVPLTVTRLLNQGKTWKAA